MAIVGDFSDLSLPELFHLIEQGKKTGLLTIRSALASPPICYYLWVHQGHLVAMANALDGQGLITLIEKYQWVSNHVVAKLGQWCFPTGKPLGLCLKHYGVLNAAQLKQLFQVQVLEQIGVLFQLKNAQFKFEQNVPLAGLEMTGFSIPATKAALMGLRSLQHWDILADKLPDKHSGLISTKTAKLLYRLEPLESRILEYSQGTVSLKMMARELRLPIEKVQQIAFILITIGLVEEVSLCVGNLPTQAIELSPAELKEDSETKLLSQSFVQNLVSFLNQTKAKVISVGT